MIFRPSKITVNASLAQPAATWMADVPGIDFFLGASSEDRVSFTASYDLDGEPQTLDLVTEGVIDIYHLGGSAGRGAKMSCQCEGRDQMAHLLDGQFRLVYRNGPAPTVVDGALTIPEVQGLFAASEIARQVAEARGLTLIWDCPDYMVQEMFQAVGRPIDILGSLVRPFMLVAPRQVDVFTEGATVVCRQRTLVPVAPPENTFSIHDARIKILGARKFRTDRIGLVSLQGMSTPGAPTPGEGGAGGGGQVPFLTWPTPTPITWPTPLTATQLNATANVDGEWTYSPGEGTSLDPGNQKITASFTPTDPLFKAGTISVTLEVQQIASVIVWANPADVVETTVLGGTQLNATATDPDAFPLSGVFTYKPPSGTVLTAGTKALSVKFSPSDSTHYAEATASVTLVVTGTPPPNTPALTWGALAPIVQGEELTGTQLNASADVSGIFDYTPDAGTVLSKGTKTLKVHFVPDDPDYEDVTAEQTIVVVHAQVFWTRPADMLVGEALGAGQLSATSNVDGTFVYDPPAATVMTDEGVISLSVTFTPTATGPEPITASEPCRVLLVPDGAGGGGTWTLVIPSSDVATDAAGRVLAAVHMVSTYRMPDQLLISEERQSFSAKPDLTGGSVLEATESQQKTLEYEPSVVSPTGLALNQPRQLSETTATSRFLPFAGLNLEIARSEMQYTYDDPSVDPRGLLSMTVLSEYALEGTLIIQLNESGLGGPGELPPLNLTRRTTKQYRDHTPDFYIVSTRVDTWSGTLWLNTSIDESVAAGTRPGGINSGAGTLLAGGVVGELPNLAWESPEGITYPTALSATQLNATADVGGVFGYSPGEGAILKPGSRHLLATFVPSDARYQVTTISETLSVQHGTPIVTWNDPVDIAEGEALSGTELNATADVGGIFQYAPPIGRVMKAGTHALRVTFTPSDDGYEVVTESVTLIVTGTPAPTTPTLSWATPGAVSEGVRLSATQLNATADVDGVFEYSPPVGTLLAAGSHPLHVRFTPADEVTYKSATASVTLTVTNVVVSWGKPADVPVGTALDDTQLDATANVDGEFAYTPGLGTVVAQVGSVTLSVTFTPADGGAAVTKSVTLKVVDAGAGTGTGVGAYASVERRVDPDPTATPLGLSDSNLDQATLELIYDQVAPCSALWQWEVSLSGAGIPWLRRGSLLQLTDLEDDKGNAIPLPALLIQSVNLSYDQIGQKAVTRDVVAIAWTAAP